MKNLGLTILVSLISAITAIALYKCFEEPREVIIREQSPSIFTNLRKDNTSTTRSFQSSSPTNFITAAKLVTPGVVNIKSTQNGEFDFWGSGSYGSSSGSGVIISSDGYIVTNNHVIEEGTTIEVTLEDKRKRIAKVVGTDTSTDLALLKIDGTDFPTLNFGNSDSIHVGEWVLAVGNPFNLESTVTAGIVSAKGRDINILEGAYSIESFIQTDAAVNPGNSGGALVNTNGELIGINTAIITRSGKYEGYSFAIPANIVQKTIRDLKDYGVVQRAILGVGIDEVTDEIAKDLGLKSVVGVYITRVTPGSGADDADIKRGDVIMTINGNKTHTIPQLQEQVARYRPGNTITVEFIRAGQTKTASVTLKNRSNTTELLGARKSSVLENVGFELRDLTSGEKKRLRFEGAYVVSVIRGSTIERTNMDPGFIITKVNDTKVMTVEEVIAQLKGAEGKVMLEGYYESFPGEYYYAFPI